ncbi:MAG: PAS domain-containing protein, partial [Thermodesulfobacteriota bacterium]|nr:PAS domain-containing protein [Thermodesulfobacteriota bacterium]
MMLTVALLPIIIFLLCFSVFKIGYVFSIAITGILAAFTAFFAARIIFKGVGHPVSVMSDAVKSFRESEYKLDAPLPKEGWKEANVLISALNRLMLELSAYRSFQLNQVVEERAKAQALIETISDAILLVDDRGRLLHSNKLALRILKISREDQDIVLPASVGEEGFHPVLKNILVSSENYLKTDVSVQGPDRE